MCRSYCRDRFKQLVSFFFDFYNDLSHSSSSCSNIWCLVSSVNFCSNADGACLGIKADSDYVKNGKVPDGECNTKAACCNEIDFPEECERLKSGLPRPPMSLGRFASKHIHARSPTTNNDEPEAAGEEVFPSQFPTPSLSPYSTSNGEDDRASHPGVTVTDEPSSSSISGTGTSIPTAFQEENTPTYGPTSGESNAAEVPAEFGCSQDFCSVALSGDCTLAYKINDGSTITVELTCDGSGEWVGIGFSKDGQMQNSEAVLGVPGHQPLKYALNGKYTAAVIQMPENKQTLMDATLESDEDGRTVMKFTKILNEHMLEEEEEIYLLYAKGMTSTLGYHPNRSSFKLAL